MHTCMCMDSTAGVEAEVSFQESVEILPRQILGPGSTVEAHVSPI